MCHNPSWCLFEVVGKRAAGGVLTAKQAPHRPGTAPAPGLHAWEMSRHSNADRIRKGDPSMRLHSWLGRPKRGRTRRRANPILLVQALDDRIVPAFLAPA